MGRVTRSQSKKELSTDQKSKGKPEQNTPPVKELPAKDLVPSKSPKRLALAEKTNSILKPEPGPKGIPAKTPNTIKNYFSPAPKNVGSTEKRSSLKKQTDKVDKHVPVYKSSRMSTGQNLPPEQRIQVYEFEIDENEPKVKKLRKKKRCTKPKTVTKFKKKVAPLRVQNLDENVRPEPSTRLLRPNKFTPVEPDIVCCDSNSLEASFGPKTMSSIPASTPFHTANDQKKVSTCYFSPMEPDIACPNEDVQTTSNRLSTSFSYVPESHRTPAKSAVRNHSENIPILFEDTPIRETSRCETSYNSPTEIPTSTPVKYNSMCSISYVQSGSNRCLEDTSDLNVTNFFGFDEPDSVEEPLVSPIKQPQIQAEIEKQTQASTTKKQTEDKPETVPVKQIIKMLRFGEEAASTSRCDNDESDEEELAMKDMNFFNDHTPEVKETIKTPARRSYERPFRQRKNRGDDEHSSSESDTDKDEKQTKQAPAKKKNALSKKEQMEFTNWVKSFNSECNQVDNFELCIE